MSRLGMVQQKMPCLFVTQVKAEPSAKWKRQPFKVLAMKTINQKALDANIYNAIPTEKVGCQWKKNSKQYCWHTSVVDYEFELALIMKNHTEEPGFLEISLVPLSDLSEQTLELIGTNINANLYGLGDKKYPIHFLVPHGMFQIKNTPALNHDDLLSWFDGCKEGKIEGIVWRCIDGNLIKLHWHHLGLCWPIADLYLISQPVIVTFSGAKYDYNFEPKTLFHYVSKLEGQRLNSLRDIMGKL